MRPRLLGVALLVALAAVLAVPAATAPALAEAEVEAPEEEGVDEALPSLEEVGTGSEVAEQFRPEPPEEPPFTDALVLPLTGAALLLATVILVLYLRWMPKFSQEREEAGRR